MNKKRNSIYLVIGLLVLSLALLVIFTNSWSKGTKVVISISGKTVKTLNLNKNQQYKVVSDFGENVIEIKNGEVFVSYSNCNNQICVHTPAISLDFPSVIVCLPHELIIELSE